MTNYGKAIRTVREAKGWTVLQLSERLQSKDVAWWVDMVEANDFDDFDESDLPAFADAFDMPLATLLLLCAEDGEHVAANT